MAILYRYLRHYWKLAAAALVLAAINQVFSLLDPLIFRHIIDSYATRYSEYSSAQFLRGVSVLLGAAVGVAFVSRVAKNFQDYFVNLITQQVGARIYADGIRHSLELPYTLFEDQRSGETLGKLQKVRTDVEKFIATAVNMVFTTLIGLVFVMIYASRVHWSVAPAYLLTVPLLGGLSSVLSRKIKEVQKHIVRETTALAGATTESLRNIELVKSLGLAQQEIARLNATTAKILKLELKKVRYLRSLSFVQGTCVNLLRTSILFLMLYLIFTQRITVGQFFSLFIYSFFIFGPLQELGNVINVYRETEVSLQNFEAILEPAAGAASGAAGAVDLLETAALRQCLVPASVGFVAGAARDFVPGGSRRDHRVRGAVRGGENHARETAGGSVPAEDRAHLLQRNQRKTKSIIDGLRERIGFVTQDAQLFSGSIRENLLFVRPRASDEDCLNVSQRMSLAIFISDAASVLSAPLVNTTASWAASAAKCSAPSTNGRPVSSAILRARQLAEPAGAFRPVPTAVPPMASSYRPGSAMLDALEVGVELRDVAARTPGRA